MTGDGGFMQTLVEGFWNPYIWFPSNITWEDVAPGTRNGIVYREYNHIYLPIPMGILMLGLRLLIEKYCFAPVAMSLGLEHRRPQRAAANPVLEKAYSPRRNLDRKQVQGLAKQLDWSERQVERWLRLRRSADKPTTLVKFCENSWRCLYYSCITTLGTLVLWDKSWLWDVSACWINYPHHSITDGVWWYYMLTLAFNWSLTISQMFDVKRKDFWEMFIHHIVTIFLLSFSWYTNHQRTGTLIILIHDSSDIFLEGSKVAKYAKYDYTSYVLFGTFTVVWIITRLVIFPSKIIYNGLIEILNYIKPFPGYYIYNALLIALFVLHIIWTYLILKFYAKVYVDINAKDVRSSSSEHSEESKGRRR